MKSITVTLLLIVSMLSFAQTNSTVVWSLTANQNAVVNGNLTAGGQSLSNLQVTYSNSMQRCSPLGTPGTWPGDAGEVSTRFMQFAFSPASGYVFNWNELSIILFSSAGSNMRATVYYSKDSTFTTKTQVGTTWQLGSSALTAPNIINAPNLSVASGETVYIRIYPWYTAATTTKYIITKSVTVSGISNSSIAMIPSSNLIEGFIQYPAQVSEIQNYQLSGSNLTNPVIITPPAHYELSNNNGGTWYNQSSPIQLPVSGGVITGQPVEILVRLNGDSSREYHENIIHTSAGAPENLVLLRGKRLSNEPTTVSQVAISNTTGNRFTISMMNGNGEQRVVIMRQDSAVSLSPIDGRAIMGIDSNFSSALDLGNGNKAIYSGNSNNVTVSGLQSAATYFVKVYEFNNGSGNTQNYLTSSFGFAQQTTLAVASLELQPLELLFGNAVVNNGTVVKSYSLTGKFLTTGGMITITAPDGFGIAETESGPFLTSLQISYTGNGFQNRQIHVQFKPTQLVAYEGYITHTGGGANEAKVLVKGKGVSSLVQTTSPVGFATLGGGTTGGEGGAVVTITEPQQLADILKLREKGVTTPLIVYIPGVLSGYTTQFSVKRTANISFIGTTPNAKLLGFGMKLVEATNIIVRNITFADCKVDEKDGLSISESHNVWVDHCSFTDSPSSDPNGSSHDGQLDVKTGSYNVTLSFNKFQNHRKTCLLGHTPGQTSDSVMKVTYFANWFDGTYSRHPRIRFAKAHILNNLYTNTGIIGSDRGGYGIGVTCSAQVLAEGNYFDNTPTPILISGVNDTDEVLSGDPTGFLKSVNNITVSSGALVENLSGFTFNPQQFYQYGALNASEVKGIVMENAGAGIITLGNEDVREQVPAAFQLRQNYPNPFNPSTTLSFSVEQRQMVSLKIYDVLGKEIVTLFNGEAIGGQLYNRTFNAEQLPSGIYFGVLSSGKNISTRKLVLLK